MADGPIHEDDLLAYVDGCLDADRRRAVKDWLDRNPAAARRVAADLAINAGLRRLFPDPVRPPGPGRLPRQAVVALALVAAGAAGGWTLAGGGSLPPAADGSEQMGDGWQAASTDGEPADALAAGLRQTLRAPDLSSAGLRLIGQEVEGNAGRPVLRLTYEGQDHERVTLFVQLREDPGTGYRRDQREGLLLWTDGPLSFALAGDRSSGDLRVLAELVRWSPGRPPRRPPLLPVASGGR